MNEHWQLFLALLGVVAAWGVLIVTIVNFMFSRVMGSLKEELLVKISTITTVSDNCTRVERELLQLKAELPAMYVRREDFIRFDVGINDKLDKLRDLVVEKDDKLDKLRDIFLEKLENLEKK
jgi:hypothetical protein